MDPFASAFQLIGDDGEKRRPDIQAGLDDLGMAFQLTGDDAEKRSRIDIQSGFDDCGMDGMMEDATLNSDEITTGMDMIQLGARKKQPKVPARKNQAGQASMEEASAWQALEIVTQPWP